MATVTMKVCTTCESEVDHKEWQEHLSSDDHKRIYKKYQQNLAATRKNCKVCKNDKVPAEQWTDHLNSEDHKNNHRAFLKKEIECTICKEIFEQKNTSKHQSSLRHIAALKNPKPKKKACQLVQRECTICGTFMNIEEWKKHSSTPEHIQNYLKYKNEKLKCDVCEESFVREQRQIHDASPQHIAKQKEKYKEACTLCKKNVISLADHMQSAMLHKALEKKKEAIDEKRQSGPVEEKDQERKDSEFTIISQDRYTIQETPEDKKEYMCVLATFLAVRHALGPCDHFQISIRDSEWKKFGDIVFHFYNYNYEKVKIVAIQCRKIESKRNYSTLALSAEKGRLSLKEQCEFLGNLKSNPNYDKVHFHLHTISDLSLQDKFIYDEAVVKDWKEELSIREWKGRQVEIHQPTQIERDLFNTTDDSEDVSVLKITNTGNEALEDELKKLRFYTSQKNIRDLKEAIGSLLANIFNFDFDITNDLIGFIRQHFKLDRAVKLHDRNYKITRHDVLLKIAELLMDRFLVIPGLFEVDDNQMEIWAATIEHFDIIMMDLDENLIKTNYKYIHSVLKREIPLTGEKFKINFDAIENENLKMNLLLRDDTLRYLYFALWKSRLVPLVFNVDEKYLSSVLKALRFFKNSKLPLKCVISGEPSGIPHGLNVFTNFRNLTSIKKIWSVVQNLEIQMLNFPICLKDIIELNPDVLQRLKPDMLLNLLLKDYSFSNCKVELVKECSDNVIVLADDYIQKIQTYFNTQDNTSDSLTYIVEINGVPTSIKIPPEMM